MEDLSVASLFLRALAVLALVAANAFFVAIEFGLVAASRTRIEAMARQGDRGAKSVQVAYKDLYRQLSAAQLGITLASILLGFVAEDTVAVVLHGWLAALPTSLQFLSRAAVVSTVAVGTITFLHVVLGEQAPKAWAITNSERAARWFARPLMVFSWITRPATNVLNWSANRVVRVLGIKGTAAELEKVHSPKEIIMMLQQIQKAGRLDREDVEMVKGVFEFTERRVRDVMTPRTEMVALPAALTVAEAAERVAETGRSRYPVYRESLDDVIGVVHVKEILARLLAGGTESLSAIARDPLFVPGTREVEDLLADLKRLQVHMAVVLDEYGGTAGIVTMEDLLEEIVGEIYDEYDRAEPQPQGSADEVVVPGETELDDLDDPHGFKLRDTDYLTVGGYVFGRLGRLPKVGDVVRAGRIRIEVLQMDGKRVRQVRMVRERPAKGAL